jgi:hypothetical protein
MSYFKIGNPSSGSGIVNVQRTLKTSGSNGKVMARRANFFNSFHRPLASTTATIDSNSASYVTSFTNGINFSANEVNAYYGGSGGYGAYCFPVATGNSTIGTQGTYYGTQIGGGIPIWMVDSATCPTYTYTATWSSSVGSWVPGWNPTTTNYYNTGLNNKLDLSIPIPNLAQYINNTAASGTYATTIPTGTGTYPYGDANGTYRPAAITDGSGHYGIQWHYFTGSFDWPMLIWDVRKNALYELYNALPINPSITGPQGWAINNGNVIIGSSSITIGATGNNTGNMINSSGALVNSTGGGLSGSGLSYLATLVTQQDIKQGSIDHMVSVFICPGPNPGNTTYPSYTGATWRPPAIAQDFGTGSATYGISEGMIFRFPAGSSCPANASGYYGSPTATTPYTRMLYNAIRDYGMVIFDMSGSVFQTVTQDNWSWAASTGQPSNSTGDPITLAMAGANNGAGNLPWSTLQCIASPSNWPTY